MYSHHTLYREIISANPHVIAGASRRSARFGGTDTYRGCLITRLFANRALKAMRARW